MRTINPLYSVTNPERFESINCSFADQVYRKYLIDRYGVKSCNENTFDVSWLKKEILDLELARDPRFCLPPPVCYAPCAVFASVMVFNTKSCPLPKSPVAEINVPIIVCDKPENLTATIIYQIK